MDGLVCKIKDYIQPFERHLALAELRALTRGPVTPLDGDNDTAIHFIVTHRNDADHLRSALAYWCSVGSDTDALTLQLRSEATSLVARNGVDTTTLPETVHTLVPRSLPNKRCLRYATHGLHEYRGKFFPQLVRSLMNSIDLPGDAVIVDPMCGSGTTLVEAFLSGRRCFGLDRNPLSVFISDVKCEALTLEPSELLSSFAELQTILDRPLDFHLESRKSDSFSDSDRAYLHRWFSSTVLLELDHIDKAIASLSSQPIRNFFSVCLSNILRGVSWQKNEDLRIRREVSDIPPGETGKRFLAEAQRSARLVAAFLIERGSAMTDGWHVDLGDARFAASLAPQLAGNVDAVITSPPYATALPYIDTDRLSLVYLGLLPRNAHRHLDSHMIGNREVTLKERDGLWMSYEQNRDLLPNTTRMLIEKIHLLNKNNNVGFRRRNLAALLSKYFFDMRLVIQDIQTLLRPGGTAFLVVGNNRTRAGGRNIEIKTAHHLERLAAELGFQPAGSLSMEMLVSRDIFRRNAMPSERILMLKRT